MGYKVTMLPGTEPRAPAVAVAVISKVNVTTSSILGLGYRARIRARVLPKSGRPYPPAPV